MKKFSKKQWIKFSIAAVLYLLFTLWMQNAWLLLGLIVLVDIFLTGYIPWGAWKRTKNPQVRNVLEWVDDILCIGCRLFHQYLYFPELPDSQFLAGEVLVSG